MESAIIGQIKKSQAETNRQLVALIAAQDTTNAWLARIAALLEAQQAQRPQQAPMHQGGVGYQQQPGRF